MEKGWMTVHTAALKYLLPHLFLHLYLMISDQCHQLLEGVLEGFGRAGFHRMRTGGCFGWARPVLLCWVLPHGMLKVIVHLLGWEGTDSMWSGLVMSWWPSLCNCVWLALITLWLSHSALLWQGATPSPMCPSPLKSGSPSIEGSRGILPIKCWCTDHQMSLSNSRQDLHPHIPAHPSRCPEHSTYSQTQVFVDACTAPSQPCKSPWRHTEHPSPKQIHAPPVLCCRDSATRHPFLHACLPIDLWDTCVLWQPAMK